jgi:hypothetical protein
VVAVDVQVALGVDLQPEPTVASELLQHVIEERQPGRHRHVAAVDIEGDGDRRLLGLPRSRG